MWVIFAFASALFGASTAIFAKCGVKQTDSTVATTIQTTVALGFSWIAVFVAGSQSQLTQISTKTMLFLVLSGIATGSSWLCYFKALKLGNISKVASIDKSSIVLTIILAMIFFQEQVNEFKLLGLALIAAGTFLVIEKKDVANESGKKSWLFFAVGSALFASLTAILGKIGISGIESNLGTAIRTSVVLVMAWGIVLAEKKKVQVPKRELRFICFSGIASGVSLLCYFKALKDGIASIVVSIDGLSIVITLVFARIIFGEKLNKKQLIGLSGMVAGILAMQLK